jgi:hypothetical protein
MPSGIPHSSLPLAVEPLVGGAGELRSVLRVKPDPGVDGAGRAVEAGSASVACLDARGAGGQQLRRRDLPGTEQGRRVEHPQVGEVAYGSRVGRARNSKPRVAAAQLSSRASSRSRSRPTLIQTSFEIAPLRRSSTSASRSASSSSRKSRW